MTNLEKQLTAISKNEIQSDGLLIAFDDIATSLLRHTMLVAEKSQYLIREIEFYFSGEYYNHFDTYAHSNQYKTVQRQGQFGEWYFHRYKSADNYSKQKFRGLDISFGNEKFKNFGGILIRKIEPIETAKIIDGISNIVGEIIDKIGTPQLHTVATEIGKFVFDTNCSLHLEDCDNSSDKPIYKTTRVIPQPDSKSKEEFYSKQYRYFNYPEIKLVRP